jgi:hypothetical protein
MVRDFRRRMGFGMGDPRGIELHGPALALQVVHAIEAVIEPGFPALDTPVVTRERILAVGITVAGH